MKPKTLDQVIEEAGSWYMGEWVSLPEHIAKAIRSYYLSLLPEKQHERFVDALTELSYRRGYNKAIDEMRKRIET